MIGEGINGRKLTRKGTQRRTELLHSAMVLFSELGYEATTTKAIADRSGVTEAVVFRYFPTKRDLFREVVNTYGPRLHYPMPYEELRQKPFGEALQVLIRGYLDNNWTNRRSIRIFLLATFSDTEIQRELGALFDFRQRRLKEMLEERSKSGELKPGVAGFAAEVITLSVTGFMVRALRSEPPNFPRARDEFLRDLARTVEHGLLA